MRFTMRDWLWLTVLLAVAIAWWIDHRAQTQRLDDLRMQWLYSIPPPFPAPGVRERQLEEENAQLRTQLEELQLAMPPPGEEPTK